MPHTRRLLSTVLFAALALVGCGRSGSPTAPSVADLAGSTTYQSQNGATTAAALRGGPAKIALCHRVDKGRYTPISIGASAEAAHRAHGDAAVGEAVPDAANKVFDANCVVVDAAAKLPPSAPPQPSLTVAATSVVGGTEVDVTLSDAAGDATDWLALAPAGSPDASFVLKTLPGAGATTYTWNVVMPTTAGIYEFRLFSGAGVRLATSAEVVVTAPPPPPPSGPALDVSATNATGGTPVTVTLSGGLGGATDWLALAATGAANTTYLQWTYVGAGMTTRTWTVMMPQSGTFEFRLFQNGGYTRLATSPTINVAAPAGTVIWTNVSSAVPGAKVTATLSGAPGGATDWLALAAVGAPNTSYLSYIYVGGGVTTKTWTVGMPATPGTYEFRLFLNNGYTRAATSPPVVVAP